MINEMFCVEREALEHTSTYICVENKALEHMKIKFELLGIIPRAFHVDVEHKLWRIIPLAIVSLDVSYKYILAFSVERKLWNCTMFVTPSYRH